MRSGAGCHCSNWSYAVGSRSFRPDQLFKVRENKATLLFFNIVSLYFNTLFNWYINLTIDGTIYPSHHFPFGATFVWQAGNFWTLLRTFSILKMSECTSVMHGNLYREVKTRTVAGREPVWTGDLQMAVRLFSPRHPEYGGGSLVQKFCINLPSCQIRLYFDMYHCEYFRCH